MNFLLVILVILAAVVIRGELLLLRATGTRVRRLGRRLQITLGLVAWLLQAATLAVIILIVSGSLLPSQVVQSRASPT